MIPKCTQYGCENEMYKSYLGKKGWSKIGLCKTHIKIICAKRPLGEVRRRFLKLSRGLPKLRIDLTDIELRGQATAQ